MQKAVDWLNRQRKALVPLITGAIGLVVLEADALGLSSKTVIIIVSVASYLGVYHARNTFGGQGK